MKAKYKYRKEWESVAKQLNMQDTQHHVVMTDPVTKNEHRVLINNYRRFVRGMCELPLEEQRLKLVEFTSSMVDLQQAQAQARTESEAQLTNLVNKPEGLE